MVRAFIAVDIESEETIKNIISLQRELEKFGKFKIVSPENLHITLKFLGEIDPSKVDLVSEILGRLEAEGFTIELKGVGCFPSPSRPNVVWIGVTEGYEQLMHIWKFVEDNLSRHGFQRERRGFKPHLTVARVKFIINRQGFRRLVETHRNLKLGKEKVRTVKLKKSTLTPTGPIYSDLYVKTL